MISLFLPATNADDDVANSIMSIHILKYSNVINHPSWVGAANGKFSVTAAYDLVNSEVNDVKGWIWFWKLKFPARFKTFTWLILHNRLPTNLLRANRRNTTDLCLRCNASPEDLDHQFRSCNKIASIWTKSVVNIG